MRGLVKFAIGAGLLYLTIPVFIAANNYGFDTTNFYHTTTAYVPLSVYWDEWLLIGLFVVGLGFIQSSSRIFR